MDKFKAEEECMIKIEELRNKMILAAMQYGLSHPLVLFYSQELDREHNNMMTLINSMS